MYIRRKVFSNVEQPEEQLYSVTMTEDELDLFSEVIENYYSKDDPDDYEGLNYYDLIRNTIDKNPLTIKKLRQSKKEHMSTEKGKGRLESAKRAVGAGVLSAIGGGALGLAKGGNKSAAALGAMAGAALGTAGGYGLDRAGRRLRNKIRKSGGGGLIDDAFSREYDRLDTLDKGGMTKEEFKKKWYRNKQAK